MKFTIPAFVWGTVCGSFIGITSAAIQLGGWTWLFDLIPLLLGFYYILGIASGAKYHSHK